MGSGKIVSVTLCFLIFLISIVHLHAQNIDFRTDESPVISWNGVPLHDARLLALAGVSSLASAPFAATVQPAVIHPAGTVLTGMSVHVLRHSAFQYRGVNQGVVYEPSGLSEWAGRIGGIAASFTLKKLTISCGWFVNQVLEFPDFEFLEEYTDGSWTYRGDFSGRENHFFLAMAVPVGRSVSLGVRFDHASGERAVETNDINEFLYAGHLETNQTRHSENHGMNYASLSLGARWRISGRWLLDAVWNHPFTGEVERSVVREFTSTLTGERLTVDSLSHTNDLVRPQEFILAATYGASSGMQPGIGEFTIAVEAAYSLWSRYRYGFFEEILPREMRDTLSVALAAE
jgi:hypothetical protein